MNMTLRTSACWIAILAIVFSFGCDDDKPTDLTEPVEQIPTPFNVTGKVGPTLLTIDWQFDPVFSYSGFSVYRSEDAGVTYNRVAIVTAPPYDDSNVRVGVTYRYTIAGRDLNEIEGQRSVAATVTAATYAVIINTGDQRTISRDVLLSFTAPAFTQNVRFGPDTLFVGAPWLTFAPSMNYTLSPGDGVKEVFAQFLDGTGNPTHVVSNTIILDTFAEIANQSYNCVTACLSIDTISPGATVHFLVEPVGNELNGSAQIFIEGQGSSPVIARDDGTLGDPTAGDGIYEVNFTYPISFRMRSMRIGATFLDEIGNESPEVEYPNNLIMSDPPAAVTLFPTDSTTATSASLRWTRSNDTHFTRYEIYRDTNPTVNPTVSVLAGSVSQIATTIFTDSGLASGTTYYYQVYVVNDIDERTGSGIESATTQ